MALKYILDVKNSNARHRTPIPFYITNGMIGTEIEVHYSDEWNGLSKTVVVEGSGYQRDIIDNDTTAGVHTYVIPWECMLEAGSVLKIGFEGRIDSSVVLRTTYDEIGTIRVGAVPSGDEQLEPSEIEELLDLI